LDVEGKGGRAGKDEKIGALKIKMPDKTAFPELLLNVAVFRSAKTDRVRAARRGG
jgi:hypothetical protein